MPNLPPAWMVDTWKPVGGCKFTGYHFGTVGTSALRFCLLLKWRAIRPQASEQKGILLTSSQWTRPRRATLTKEQKYGLQVDITPTAAGLQGMHEYRVAFPSWSQAAVFCPAHLQHHDFEQLVNSSSNDVRMGCQVEKAYGAVLLEGDSCFAVLALLLAFATQPRKKSSQKGEESTFDKVRRMASPRAWDVAFVPFPEDFAPLPTGRNWPGMSDQLEFPAKSPHLRIQTDQISSCCHCRSRGHGYS